LPPGNGVLDIVVKVHFFKFITLLIDIIVEFLNRNFNLQPHSVLINTFSYIKNPLNYNYKLKMFTLKEECLSPQAPYSPLDALLPPWVNFINILWAAFTRLDPNSAK